MLNDPESPLLEVRRQHLVVVHPFVNRKAPRSSADAQSD